MAEKKATFSEDDIYELLQRYSASTIISLFQEISEHTSIHSDTEKIDWTALVKNTTTGISNAREYQMLWRHLAYRNSLLEKVEDGAEPLDDDSDLEFELETVPASSAEELAEAKECAKVLLASGPSRDSGSASRSTVDPFLAVDIKNDQALLDSSDKLASSNCGINHVLPLSGQKQPLPTGSCIEDLDGNGLGNSGLPAKKRRQLWTKEEDMELIAAVQKCGEGNWANILKGDFKHNRTASQLSQRWAIIRKRQANSNTGNGSKISNSTLSEERLAAQKAFSMAVNMPMTGSISSKFSGATQAVSSSTSSAAISEASPASIPQSLNQSQDKGVSNSLCKPRTTLKKPANPQPSVGPNPLIQAAAFAAGGRIANPSTAASLFKAAQSKNVVHIRPGGGSLPIPSAMVSKPLSTSTTSGAQSAPRQVRPSLTQPPSATFGTIMSATKATRPASLLFTGGTTMLNSSTQQTSLESKQGASQGVSSQENVKSGISSDICAIDVDKSSEEVGEDAAEMRSDDAATQKGQTDVTNSFASETQDMVEKECQLEKKATDDKGLLGGAGDIEIPAKEGESMITDEEASAVNQNVHEEPSGHAEVRTETVAGVGTKTPVNGKVAE